MVKFSDIFDDVTKQGRKIQTSEYKEQGKYPIIDQGQKEIAGYTDEEEGLFTDVPAIIFGDHTRVIKYVDTPCFLGADGVKLLRAKIPDPNYKYLYYALSNVRIPNTGYNRHFKWLKEALINLPSHETQSQVVDILDRVNILIIQRMEQLEKLDQLVKSQFIEMFGSGNYPEITLENYVNIIDGDRGKNYPKSDDFFDDEYCLFLNAKNVTKEGFRFEEKQFITKEKDIALRKGKLHRGDIVLTTRGTVGNIAFYDDTIPYDNMRINSGMVILRPSQVQYNQVFFVCAFKNKLTEVLRNVTGSAQPQLPISTLKNIRIVNPPIELQNHFSAFVQQAGKLKFAIQQSLEQLETLKKSLMQEYFG